MYASCLCRHWRDFQSLGLVSKDKWLFSDLPLFSRTLECIQTFTPEPNLGVNSFCTAEPYNQIFAGSRILYSFQWDRPGKPWVSYFNLNETLKLLCSWHVMNLLLLLFIITLLLPSSLQVGKKFGYCETHVGSNVNRYGMHKEGIYFEHFLIFVQTKLLQCVWTIGAEN